MYILKYIVVLLFLIVQIDSEEDFYQLLGVSKDADNREIRKAFKQLAVKLHPDKNPDDKNAQAKFIHLTKAYDTLKDPESRKHYDLYGDVKNSEKYQKGQYQSYTYYRDEFGIYDDDPLIITLGYYEFENSINDPNVAWFVNFYSPQCSHCHELAPIWRKLAAELEGVVRIAAVNCHDDWQLCATQMEIRAFPTLMYFSKESHIYEGEKYTNMRSVEDMVDFILQRLNPHIQTITPEDWTENKFNEREWLLFLCGENDGVCPERNSMLKLTAMLDGLVPVGIIKDSKLCTEINSLYVGQPVVFWQLANENLNDIPKSEVTAHSLTGFDSHDLINQVLELLPDLKTLTREDFQDIRTRLRLGGTDPWLICFYLGAATELNLQLKRLPALLSNMNIGKVHCAQNADLCASLHISRYPTWAILKAGGAFEVHHGKDSLHDVVAFSRDSSHATNLHALSPADVRNILKDGEVWFIDWYAPWCPPCQRLMPELRRASQHFTPDNIQFGTVDCTLHSQFCSQHGIRSYPTTAFYNGTKKHYFQGHLQEQSIVDFIHDMINPVVISLNPSSFRERLIKKPENELWIVDFFAPWCGPCQEFAPEYRILARGLEHLENVHLAEVDCVEYASLCSSQNVRSYPTIRLYPTGSTGLNTVAMYNGHRESTSLKKWILGFLPSPILELNAKEFQDEIISGYTHELPWLVDFYAPWCSHCHDFEPEFITVAQRLDGVVRTGKLNCDMYKRLCRDENVNSYPSVILYITSSLRYEIDTQISQEIIQRVKKIIASHRHDEL